MSYRLAKFGTVNLPCARLTGTYGTGPTVDATTAVIGGTVDAYATTDGNLDVPYEMTYSAMIIDTEADAQTKLDELMGLRGYRHILYREIEGTETYHWCWARCLQVRNPWQWQRKTMNPIDIVFQMQSPWYGVVYGTGWSLDTSESLMAGIITGFYTSYTLTTTSEVLAVHNPGNCTTRLVSARLPAGGSSITEVGIAVGSTCDIGWTGTLTVGNDLELNGRTMSITNNSVNAYNGFAFGPAHTSGWWLELASGWNSVTVTRTGGDATSSIYFDYAAGWG